MSDLQKGFLILYALGGILLSFKGYIQSRHHRNGIGEVSILNLYGAFVWADIVVFGMFWALVVIVIFFLNDWVLFLLTQSLFWLVRSIGETVYWFNQQFSQINRSKSWEKKFSFKIFHDEYVVWFVSQIFWQCMTVIFLITSIYLIRLWLITLAK